MSQSAAELLLATQLEQVGIGYHREWRFAPPRRWRADFAVPAGAFESPSLLVEIDGGGFIAGRHSRGLGMEHDAEKASAAAILGYRVIRCTPSQVEDGRALGWIQDALGLARSTDFAALVDSAHAYREREDAARQHQAERLEAHDVAARRHGGTKR